MRVELTFQWDLIRSAWDLIHQGTGGCKIAGCLKLESLHLCLFGLPACASMGGGASAAASASFEVARVDGKNLANQLIWYNISYSTGCFKMVPH